MVAFLLSRIVQSIVVILVMSVVVFAAVNVVGSPVDVLVSQNCTGVCRDQVIHGLGLDKSLPGQYASFVANALHGDLGRSFAQGLPAGRLILDRLPATLELAATTMVFAVLSGIPLGLWAGMTPGKWSDRIVLGGSALGFSIPTFWFALILIIIFGIYLGWLPPTGRGQTVRVLGIDLSILTLDGWRHILMPAISLAMFKTSLVIRLTRAGVREVMLLDYVKYARAKGVPRRRVIVGHVLRNVLIPVVTVLGLELGNVIAFSVVTETVFAWPGIGKLLIDSILVLDRPVIVSYLMLTVTMFVVINLAVDILYSVLDPRVRLGRARA
jgi:peptide/nickel transport system permease protein